MLRQQTLKGHFWEELRPALLLVLYGSVGATHQSGIMLDKLLYQEQARQFHEFHATLLLWAFPQRECLQKDHRTAALVQYTVQSSGYYAMNLGNMLTWSSFPTWSQLITQRDVFWTVTARVEWVRSALRHSQGRTGQVLSCLADQGSWPFLCLWRDSQASDRPTPEMCGGRSNDWLWWK